MKFGSSSRIVSTLTLIFATLLVLYGIYGLSHFVWYSGEYFDDNLIVFDNGVYPFLWGCFLLVITLILRLHYRRIFIFISTISGLLLFFWKRFTIPNITIRGQELFPDASLLNELIIICLGLLILALADKYVQGAVDLLLIRPYRVILNAIKKTLKKTSISN